MKQEDFLSWDDVRARDALIALGRLKSRLTASGHNLSCVFIMPLIVAQGYVFIVENAGRWYALMNANDFKSALAGLPTYKAEAMDAQVMGVPLSEDVSEAMKAMCGVFTHVSRIKR